MTWQLLLLKEIQFHSKTKGQLAAWLDSSTVAWDAPRISISQLLKGLGVE